MLRVLLVLLMLSLPLAPAHADAQTVRDAVVQELRDDGFTRIRISRTLLGRLRFVADRPGARREIVVSPRTGIVLRDYLRLLNDDDDDGGAGQGGPGTGNASGGGHDEDDDDYDDEDDDYDDEDDDQDDDEDDDDDDDRDDSEEDESDDD